jgi:peptidyl-prolyl cis-trans isomerase A (cyclophilin A)/peptidyl-prolyl cis-trans isomerase B (cyclophilin B)
VFALVPASALLPAIGLLLGCGSSSTKTVNSEAQAATASPASEVAAAVTPTSSTNPQAQATTAPNPVVVLHSSLGDIKLELYADKAPRTVDNFLRGYAERGYYDQTIFHHVEPGQMLIAGGYSGELERKPPRAPIYNESRTTPSNRRGTVAMAREPEAPHSATADFFINLGDNPALDYQPGDEEDQLGYCVFGEVIEGMEVVERIASLDTTVKSDFPKVPTPTPTILSIERLR